MTEATETVESTIASAVIGSEPKLWAGKYKTAEEMEEALIGKDKEYGKLYSEHSDIKKQYEEKTTVPEKYDTPTDIVLRESELAEIQTIARNAGLTQAQFEKTAREMQGRIQQNMRALETAKSEIGQDKLTIITDHIKKNYPESVQQAVLNQVIKDKTAMSDILKERDSRLNSQVPGMDRANQGSPTKYDGEKELKEAAEAFRRNPSQKTKDRYIDVARQVGEERYKDKVSSRQ